LKYEKVPENWAAPFIEQDNSDRSPVVVHVPHASLNIPPKYRSDFILSDTELDEEARTMADLGTDNVARATYDLSLIKPSLFINNLSRLVFDPERFNDESEEMNSVGMGVLYSQTSSGAPLRSLSDGRSRELIETLFHPYSLALDSLVSRTLAKHGKVIIIDLHSYSKDPLGYELHKDLPRPEVCLGVDDFHTSPQLLSIAKEVFSSTYSVEINSPFLGTYVPLSFYAKESRVQSIMLEFRKDAYGSKNSDSPLIKIMIKKVVDLVGAMDSITVG
jgi:predicted N-formylglutamate amidohydrolase